MRLPLAASLLLLVAVLVAVPGTCQDQEQEQVKSSGGGDDGDDPLVQHPFRWHDTLRLSARNELVGRHLCGVLPATSLCLRLLVPHVTKPVFSGEEVCAGYSRDLKEYVRTHRDATRYPTVNVARCARKLKLLEERFDLGWFAEARNELRGQQDGKSTLSPWLTKLLVAARYGNFCGPDHGLTRSLVEPIDEIDATCRWHDNAFRTTVANDCIANRRARELLKRRRDQLDYCNRHYPGLSNILKRTKCKIATVAGIAGLSVLPCYCFGTDDEGNRYLGGKEDAERFAAEGFWKVGGEGKCKATHLPIQLDDFYNTNRLHEVDENGQLKSDYWEFFRPAGVGQGV